VGTSERTVRRIKEVQDEDAVLLAELKAGRIGARPDR